MSDEPREITHGVLVQLKGPGNIPSDAIQFGNEEASHRVLGESGALEITWAEEGSAYKVTIAPGIWVQASQSHKLRSVRGSD